MASLAGTGKSKRTVFSINGSQYSKSYQESMNDRTSKALDPKCNHADCFTGSVSNGFRRLRLFTSSACSAGWLRLRSCCIVLRNWQRTGTYCRSVWAPPALCRTWALCSTIFRRIPDRLRRASEHGRRWRPLSISIPQLSPPVVSSGSSFSKRYDRLVRITDAPSYLTDSRESQRHNLHDSQSRLLIPLVGVVDTSKRKCPLNAIRQRNCLQVWRAIRTVDSKGHR